MFIRTLIVRAPFLASLMFLCRVTGTVVSTQKSDHFRTAKLLIVHRIDTRGKLAGTNELLALDPCYDAGVGDTVLVAKEGAVVAQLMGGTEQLMGGTETDGGVPANVIIIGVIDDWSVIDDAM